MSTPRTKEVVALDFDGVVCDSMEECLLVTFLAYDGWRNGVVPSGGQVPQVPAEFGEYFRTFRYLVRPAREYWIIAHAFATGAEPLDEARFRRRRLETGPMSEAFEAAFFTVRRALAIAQPQVWVALHRIYPEFLDGWSELRQTCAVHIVTTKDSASLSQLLEAFGLPVPPERRWPKERCRSKADAVRAIAREEDVPVSTIRFVDDHPEYLAEVAAIGAQVFWASWGYARDGVLQAAQYPSLRRLRDVLASDPAPVMERGSV